MIDWSKAPEWANYWAMDGDGVGHWHENKPRVWNIGNGWAVAFAAFSGEKQEAPSFGFDKNEFKGSLRLRINTPSPAELNTMDCQGGQ